MTVKKMKILRADERGVHPAEDLLLSEGSVELILNGKRLCKISCTPSHLEEMAVGRLYDRGYIHCFEEIKSICIEKGKIRVLSDSGRILKGSEPEQAPYSFPYCDVRKAYETFAGASELFRKTGGVHSASLLDRELNPLFLAEDMSRHNVIDKMIGYGLREHVSYYDKLLMISSRMPKELVEKCIRAGIVNIASVSAATGEAAVFAREHNAQLMGMCRSSRFNIYAWREEEHG